MSDMSGIWNERRVVNAARECLRACGDNPLRAAAAFVPKAIAEPKIVLVLARLLMNSVIRYDWRKKSVGDDFFDEVLDLAGTEDARLRRAILLVVAGGPAWRKGDGNESFQALQVLIMRAKKLQDAISEAQRAEYLRQRDTPGTFENRDWIRTQENWVANAKARAEKERIRDAEQEALMKVFSAERERLDRLAKIGEVFESVYDAIALQGKPVGEIWYHDLGKMESAGRFDSSLARQIRAHVIPNAPTQVRDCVSEEALTKMVKIAVNECMPV
jgi:hypothetical protein